MGTILGKYELIKELGKGGFGTVYQAMDIILDVERAVKVLHPVLVADTSFVARFKQEAQLAAKLEHPNLVPVYDYGEEDGRFYFSMKFMPGGSLKDLLEKKYSLDEETAFNYFIQAANGVGYAHSKSIVHRDLKPSNILFDLDKNVRISDLGFAKSMDGGTKSQLSTSGMMVGTPAYMAPEIWRGKPATPASDIYSMGCILFEMLTGKVLFEGDSPADVMTKHVLDGPCFKDYSDELVNEVVQKALNKDPKDRYQSMSEFVVELKNLESKGERLDIPEPPVVQMPEPPETVHDTSEVTIEPRFVEINNSSPVSVATPVTSVIPPVINKPRSAEPLIHAKPKKEPGILTGKTLGFMVIGVVALVLIIGGVSGWFNASNKHGQQASDAVSPTMELAANSDQTTNDTPTTTVEPTKNISISTNAVTSESLSFNGFQWGEVVCWNPYSSNCNNALAIAQQDNARTPMFETPYLFNMLDGKVYPLLADGPYNWDGGKTKITFKVKSAAKWSDGTPVTADDVAYTWASHLKHNTTQAATYKEYITDIIAIDSSTVEVQAVLGSDGRSINPFLVQAYLSSNYVIQKRWTQTLEARTNGDDYAFANDVSEDVIFSGPYHKFVANTTEVVLIRDDNYWGQDSSMWGSLPAPKYLSHKIYSDNAEANQAFESGEVDVSQQFITNVQYLWLNQNLPVSTYLDQAPYNIGASLSTAFYNLNSHGLDNVSIRKAIAIAVDYDTINTNAMTNQSATFNQVPRSLMNQTPGEQVLFDHNDVADLQWAGNDIQGAKALLDAAGVVDQDGDGWREYQGKTLSYIATCPNGWSDWQAAIEVVAAAGAKIGIKITTNYPEWPDFQTVVTNSPITSEGYDIFMMWSLGAGPSQPWQRIDNLLNSNLVYSGTNWTGNWGGYSNPDVDRLLAFIPQETSAIEIKAAYTELVKIYLTDVPSFTLMYRPQAFHTVNESVWTNFPHEGDGTNPPVPPLDLLDGWSIAGLYNLRLVNP